MNRETSSVNDEEGTITRCEIFVMGQVQQVGYRGIVVEIGRKRRLKGFVENLSDGSVKIIVEGKKNVVQRFIEEINIRNGVIEVKEMDVDFSGARGEFRGFSVKISDIGYEMFQGFGTAKRYLDGIGNKIDQGFDKMGGKIDTGFERTSQHFESLDEKYHTVSDELKGIRQVLEKRLSIEEEKVKYSAEKKDVSEKKKTGDD